MKNPVVSVIMPVKGRLELVKEALESVYAQKDFFPDKLEVFLIEEKNEPQTILAQIKKLFPRVKTFINQDKEGPGGARNTGLQQSTGKYILFLDSDDKLLPQFMEKMTDTLETDKKSVAAVCLSDSFFGRNFKLSERIKLYPLMLIRDLVLISGTIFNKGYLFPSSFYLCQISHMLFKSGRIKKLRFDYKFRRGGEDWDFIVGSQKSGPIRIVPEKLLHFRYLAGSSTDRPLNRKMKWLSYSKLTVSLPGGLKKGFFYKLFLLYISLFQSRKN